jgi:dsDNA-binding SOS-regulon protein
MSNIKFHTNRQVALQMAMEHSKRTMGSYGNIGGMLEYADKFYEWLQDAPMKDEDNQFWLDGSTKTKPNGKNK